MANFFKNNWLHLPNQWQRKFFLVYQILSHLDVFAQLVLLGHLLALFILFLSTLIGWKLLNDQRAPNEHSIILCWNFLQDQSQGSIHTLSFLKYGPIPASFFVYFHSFHITNQLQIEKSIDGVLGIRTRGRRIVGADETTELWRPPKFIES